MLDKSNKVYSQLVHILIFVLLKFPRKVLRNFSPTPITHRIRTWQHPGLPAISLTSIICMLTEYTILINMDCLPTDSWVSGRDTLASHSFYSLLSTTWLEGFETRNKLMPSSSTSPRPLTGSLMSVYSRNFTTLVSLVTFYLGSRISLPTGHNKSSWREKRAIC